MDAQRTHVDRAAFRNQEGIALITTIMVMMLCSVLMVGFTAAIIGDQRASGLDRDQTQAYAVAHAGLEKLTADLSTLFTTDFSPTKAQIDALMVNKPSLPGFSYVAPGGGSGYVVGPVLGYNGTAPIGDPNGTIAAGPYQGFRGILTPYDITVTARSTGGAEVRMRRQLQTVAVPVFQFGFFSELDLAFHAGEDFLFGGRVHTNGNLYLAQGNNSILTIGDRATAVGEVIRTHLPNGLDTSGSYNGTVKMIKAANSYRNLARNEGSLVNTIGSALNEPKWTNVSIGSYNSYIRNGRTGARRLDLPIVSDANADGVPDANPIELIRRPTIGVADPGLLSEERFYKKASIRILLSDTAAQLSNLPGVTADAPVDLSQAGNLYAGAAPPATRPPLAASPGPAVDGTLVENVHKSDAGTSLVGGFIKIEKQSNAGVWTDVTTEILALGIAGKNIALNTGVRASRWNTPGAACAEPNPDAVIRLQRVRDVPFDATDVNNAANNAISCGYTLAGGVVTAVSQRATDYWPLALYDAREGQQRDGMAAPAAGTTNMALGGIMHYVELDVNNLRRWFAGQIGATGNQARNVDNGFIVYFSDRRNNDRDGTNRETGEYGFEDIINTPNMNSFPAGNGTLEVGEDLNGNAATMGNLPDRYGMFPRNIPACGLLAGCTADIQAPLDANARPFTFVPAAAAATVLPPAASKPDPRLVARANRAILFRRALKLVNGGQNQLPAPGLTIASENATYIQGNYNASVSLAANEAHVAASVIADAVTLLSNNWNDIRSFAAQSNSETRKATTTAYRLAIISGKTLAFPKPTWASSSFGSDGGAHNFIRNLEDWDESNVVQRYRGSFVSFFTSRQGIGTFKCCDGDTYVRGERSWTFDTDFLSPTLLPPGTPMFRDINTLTFRQLLRPTQ
jgi:hypothetical protein